MWCFFAGVCTPCPAGRYGSPIAMNSSLCSGLCAAGYTCPEGSFTATPSSTVCPPGQYSLQGATACVNCSGGWYGSTSGSTSPQCSGACQSGAFCPPGSTTASQYTCPAGYACPPGTSNGTAFPCGPGKYSEAGAAVCTNCSAGLYGSVSTLQSPACSGVCSAGYFCPIGSTSATATLCPEGSYCLSGTSGPVPCSGGVFGASAGLGTSQCSGPCPAGFFCPGKVPEAVLRRRVTKLTIECEVCGECCKVWWQCAA